MSNPTRRNSLNTVIALFFALLLGAIAAIIFIRDHEPRAVLNLTLAQAVAATGGHSTLYWGLDRRGQATLWTMQKVSAPSLVMTAKHRTPAELTTARLILLTTALSLLVMVLFCIPIARSLRNPRRNEETVRGPLIEDLTTLRHKAVVAFCRRLRHWIGFQPSRNLRLGQVTLDTDDEVAHVLCVGTTGSGKTSAVRRLLESIHAFQPRSKVVVLDLGGTLKNRYGRPGDITLNPFDPAGVRWSIFHEVDCGQVGRSCMRLAASLLNGAETNQGKEWAGYALRTLAALLQRLYDHGADAKTFSGSADPETAIKLLNGRPEVAILKTSSAGSSGSIQFMLAAAVQLVGNVLASFEHCQGPRFSVREWIFNKKSGTLWITYQESDRAELKAFHSLILSELAKASLELDEDKVRRIYIFADELGSLGKVDGLEDLLTKGRKFGVGVVACLQSLGQLEEHYGPIATKNLIDNFNSLLILRTPGYQSAKYFADVISEVEIDRTEVTYSRNKEGKSSSESVRRERKQLVMPGEIMNLPKLRGFVKIGSRPGIVYKTTVPISNSDLG